MQRARLQPMLDDFPFQALSRQFSPEAWLRPFEPGHADLRQDSVSQGEPLPKCRRIKDKKSVPSVFVTPPPESDWAVLATEVGQWADEVVSSTSGEGDENIIEVFFY